MPEICEVALTGQYLMTKLKNQYITNIKVISGKYKRNKLVGIDHLMNKKNKIINVDTKGKFLWFELKDENNNDVYIMNWFGMTGEWSFENSSSARIEFTIDYKTNLYFIDQRNFGIMQITTNKKVLDDKLNSLAPDLLKSNFTVDEFHKWFTDYLIKFPKRKNMNIISLLLRQDVNDGIASGIGNYLSSEILYRARISPHTLIGDMTNYQIKKLANTIKMVMKMCYLTNKTGYMELFEDFVDDHMEKVKSGVYPDYHPDIPINDVPDFEFLVYKLKEDKQGRKVIAEHIVPQRTTYWVDFS